MTVNLDRLDPRPWKVFRDQNLCGEAASRPEAERIIKQLRKLHPLAQLYTQYRGASIPHCGYGGRPL
jgi:hypothetical protein